MSSENWMELLGWSQEQIEDLRFVAYSYLKQGLYDEALTFFEALTILSKENPYDLQTLGAIYLHQGKALLALNFLDRALKVEPQHFPTLLNRAKALFLLGYKKQALAQAHALEMCRDTKINSAAKALILSYQEA